MLIRPKIFSSGAWLLLKDPQRLLPVSPSTSDLQSWAESLAKLEKPQERGACSNLHMNVQPCESL